MLRSVSVSGSADCVAVIAVLGAAQLDGKLRRGQSCHVHEADTVVGLATHEMRFLSGFLGMSPCFFIIVVVVSTLNINITVIIIVIVIIIILIITTITGVVVVTVITVVVIVIPIVPVVTHIDLSIHNDGILILQRQQRLRFHNIVFDIQGEQSATRVCTRTP